MSKWAEKADQMMPSRIGMSVDSQIKAAEVYAQLEMADAIRSVAPLLKILTPQAQVEDVPKTSAPEQDQIVIKRPTYADGQPVKAQDIDKALAWMLGRSGELNGLTARPVFHVLELVSDSLQELEEL